MRPWHVVIGTFALSALVLLFAVRHMAYPVAESVAKPIPVHHAVPATSRPPALRAEVSGPPRLRLVKPHSPHYGKKGPPLRWISMDDALNGANLKGNVAIDPCLDAPMTLEDCADSYDPYGCGTAVADDEIYRAKYC
jgi:hypothetical protein